MCGIAGHVSWGRGPSQENLTEMIRRLRHRGPDDAGVWVSSQGWCVLGHARLSIIDLSSAGHQPMVDATTGNAIVFNGEIYNFKELREACEAAGERFVSHTDTEVLLVLYRRYGVDCLKQLRGMFAFAIWDEAKQIMFLARDRLGKKPLNYSLFADEVLFSSEIEPLVHHPSVGKEMDNEALDLYLQLQYIPAPWTIYKNIRKLPPAHYAIFSKEGLRINKYWDVSYIPKIRVSEENALDLLEHELREAVRLRMVADVPLGALLSGGVDSSLVVAMMAGLSGEPVKTFSIGFQESKFNELPYAEAVAKRYRTDHCPEVIGGEIEPLFNTVVRHYGEPYADSSAIPSFQVCATARKHVTVAMNGDGGDELLGGYPRYYLGRHSIWAGRMMGNILPPDNLAGMASGIEKATSIGAKVRRKWLLHFSNPELRSIVMYSQFWNDRERAALLGHAGKPDALLHAWRRDWLGNVRSVADNPIDRMLWIDNHTYLPGDLLVKMDIASMHCGLETRSPLLDHKLIEFCASLPAELKVRHRNGKYLLKKLAERYIPKELIYRRKMGFAIPLPVWLKSTLRKMVMEVLRDPVLMEDFDMDVIHRTLTEFYEKEIDHSSRIWSLLMYGLWRAHARRLQ
jgi:asparagine synthase (glutamine-hydrolysing)